MIERRSALASVYEEGRFGATVEAEECGVKLQLHTNSSITVISAWPDQIDAAVDWLSRRAVIGADERARLHQPGSVVRGEQATVLRVEPLKWWLLEKACRPLAPEFSQSEIARSEVVQSEVIQSGLLEPGIEIGTRVDQSHGYVCLQISGHSAADLLNRHIALDLRVGSQGAEDGRQFTGSQSWVATTMLHHVGVTLVGVQDAAAPLYYTLYLPRGFAVSLYELLYESALQFGVNVLPVVSKH